MKNLMISCSAIIASFILSCLIISCSTSLTKHHNLNSKALNQEIQQLVNHSWIIIGKPSFSAFNKKNVNSLAINSSSPETLKEVLSILESTPHSEGKIYILKQSRFQTQAKTPGISEYKKQLSKALHGIEARALDKNALQILLDDAKTKHPILSIKTNTTIPHSTIFIELENGYSHTNSKTALRKRIIR